MKNILVLTDFSERAMSAAEYAMQLAIHIKADITLCHALEITQQLTYPLADHLVLRNQTVKRLRALGMHLNTFVEGHSEDDFSPSISYINDLDMLPDVVEKLVSNNHFDLVVIGATKSSSVSRFFFGSHTSDILDFVTRPVLLVPENVSFKSIDNVAYATDLTFNNTKVINYLAQLATVFGARITVDHITPLDLPLTKAEQAVEDSLINQMEAKNVRISYKTLKGDSVAKGLLELSDAEKVDILTLVHKRYDFFEGLFHSSVSKQLAYTSKIPLLVMPYSFSVDNEDLVYAG
mgnify:FL=1